MKIFLTALSLLCISATFAQNAIDTPETDDYLTNRSIRLTKDALNIAGTPYDNEEFQLGNIYKNGKLVANNVAIRYHVSRDQIEVKSGLNAPNSDAKILMASPAIHARVLNDVFVYIRPVGEDTPSGYFEVMHEGDSYQLYKKLKKEFIEGKKAINSVARDVPPTYKDKEALYLVDENGTLIELSGSRNRKLKAFPSHNKELKKYTKEENLNINKDYSLIKLVAYYNTLN